MLDTTFLSCRVATLWEIVLCLFIILVIFHFGFKSRIWPLIAPVPVHCGLVTFNKYMYEGHLEST